MGNEDDGFGEEAEYGDEEMPPNGNMQVSNALAEQRATKKRAQDDVKLLANRIALLKLEEKKVRSDSISKFEHFIQTLLPSCVSMSVGMEENRRDKKESSGYYESTPTKSRE